MVKNPIEHNVPLLQFDWTPIHEDNRIPEFVLKQHNLYFETINMRQYSILIQTPERELNILFAEMNEKAFSMMFIFL